MRFPNAPNRLQTFQTSAGTNVPGPTQVNSTINNTAAISEQYTFLSRAGSQVFQGSLQLLPIEDSLIYIRPIYVFSNNGQQPNFRFVVLYYAGSAVIAETIDDALRQVGLAAPGTEAPEVPQTPSTPETPSTPQQPGEDATVDSLLQQATEAYTVAEQYESNPRSVWGYVQGLTRVSQRTPWQDGRFALDRAAGRLLTLVQLEQLRVRFSTRPDQAARIHSGQSVKLRLAENNQVVDGKVDRVSAVMDAKSGTLDIHVVIDNAHGKLRSGARCLFSIDPLQP